MSCPGSARVVWRRGWDSNPRTGCPINGFRDRPIRPLWHLSKGPAASAVVGGEGGIRTHGRVSPTHAFQACSLSHSDTSPELPKNSLLASTRSKRCEEFAQKNRAGLRLYSGDDFQPVIEPRVLDQVAEGAAETRLRVGGAVDQPVDPAGHQRPRAHRAR